MYFKSFKQYIDFWYSLPNKSICGLKSAENLLQIDELVDWSHRHSVDSFRKMAISFLDFNGEGKDIGDFLKPFDLEARDITEARYAQMFLGKLPEWHLVKTELFTTGLLACYYKYDEEGKVDDFYEVDVDIPPYLKFQIDIDGCEGIPAETYIVTLKTNGEDDKIVRYEYFRDGAFQYTGDIKEDERGVYEFITEAD